jgi:hypothetical protein
MSRRIAAAAAASRRSLVGGGEFGIPNKNNVVKSMEFV